MRVYQYPFHTLGVDYVGELPQSLHGNKWILTAVCPYSNFLRAIPVLVKTVTTARNALFHNILLVFGFPSVLLSDRGGEWLNAFLDRLTLNRPGGIRPQAGSSLCCAETVSSMKLTLSEFYYILIGLNSEYKPVPWDIYCCHGNAIVEGCSVNSG